MIQYHQSWVRRRVVSRRRTPLRGPTAVAQKAGARGAVRALVNVCGSLVQYLRVWLRQGRRFPLVQPPLKEGALSLVPMQLPSEGTPVPPLSGARLRRRPPC